MAVVDLFTFFFSLFFVFSNITAEFVCPKQNGLFADPESCSKFYQCDDGISFLKLCPPGSRFDGVRRECVSRYEKHVCGPQPTTETPSTTPDPLSAAPCDPAQCNLPYCFCSRDGTAVPGGLDPKDVPQMVMMTFDGAVNHLNLEAYHSVLLPNRTNPDGCSIRATFFLSHEYTDYQMVHKYYSQGHEIATGTVTRRPGLEDAGPETWIGEMVSMREILRHFADVSPDDVFGMRAPNLKPGRNAQFEVLRDYNWIWDSTVPVPPLRVPVWPYTLDFAIPHECQAGSCPTRSFPGLWEVPLNSHFEDFTFESGYCPYLDRCALTYLNEELALQWFKKDFLRHYEGNRAPFMLTLTTNFFQSRHLHRALLAFLDYSLTLPDVYYVTVTEALQWITAPRKTAHLGAFADWDCKQRIFPAPPCERPTSCRLLLDSEAEGLQGTGGTRYMSTCATCPRAFPWVYDAQGKGRGKDKYEPYPA